jgi:hypothetical protein
MSDQETQSNANGASPQPDRDQFGRQEPRDQEGESAATARPAPAATPGRRPLFRS